MVITPGYERPIIWFIEVKVPGGKLSKRQEYVIKKLRDLDVQCFVVYNIEELEEAYSRIYTM